MSHFLRLQVRRAVESAAAHAFARNYPDCDRCSAGFAAVVALTLPRSVLFGKIGYEWGSYRSVVQCSVIQ